MKPKIPTILNTIRNYFDKKQQTTTQSTTPTQLLLTIIMLPLTILQLHQPHLKKKILIQKIKKVTKPNN